MFSKVIIASLLVVAAVGRPDRHPAPQGYGYQPPVNSYSPPRPTYAAPTKPEPTYSAPVKPEPIYSAPSKPQPTYSAPDTSEETHMPMPFNYAYAVKDDEYGTDFAHETDSDGSSTTGEYHVALPDGRTQIVKYSVTKDGGYVAEVTYEGEAIPYVPPPQTYSSSEEEPQPSYQVPQQTYGSNF